MTDRLQACIVPAGGTVRDAMQALDSGADQIALIFAIFVVIYGVVRFFLSYVREHGRGIWGLQHEIRR